MTEAKIVKNVPFIQIDFHNRPLIFKNPLKIITASAIDEVTDQLAKVEQFVKKGYYAVGFISYEASSAFNPKFVTKMPNQFPLIWFGIFKEPIMDELQRTKRFHFQNWELQMSKNDFTNSFNEINEQLKNNIIKQINFTARYETKFLGDAYSYYKQLKKAQQAKYCAFIKTEQFEILSASPELFFEMNGTEIKMRPMKGTIGRGLTYEDDINKKMWLKQSEKNKYENELALQLVYEELEKITLKNSITIDEKYRVEQYPTLFQMTSTIKGKLKNDTSLIDILSASFPAASITGTPKKEVMQLIRDVENSPRHIYCGAIGYLTPENEAIFNVPIRTVMIDRQTKKATYGVGGAMTNQSMLDEEFLELHTKGKVLYTKRPSFKLLETFGLIDGRYVVFDNHLNRLQRSAQYFNFRINLNEIEHKLYSIKEMYRTGNWRVRLLVDDSGNFKVETEQFESIDYPVPVTLSKKPIEINNPFLYHKTTYREMYKQHMINDNKTFDILLWNDKKEITEFTIGNIVVDFNGELFTPPVKSGLLPGTFREQLLRENKIKERTIYIDELKDCSAIWFINSVRGWIKVFLKDSDETL